MEVDPHSLRLLSTPKTHAKTPVVFLQNLLRSRKPSATKRNCTWRSSRPVKVAHPQGCGGQDQEPPRQRTPRQTRGRASVRGKRLIPQGFSATSWSGRTPDNLGKKHAAQVKCRSRKRPTPESAILTQARSRDAFRPQCADKNRANRPRTALKTSCPAQGEARLVTWATTQKTVRCGGTPEARCSVPSLPFSPARTESFATAQRVKARQRQTPTTYLKSPRSANAALEASERSLHAPAAVARSRHGRLGVCLKVQAQLANPAR